MQGSRLLLTAGLVGIALFAQDAPKFTPPDLGGPHGVKAQPLGATDQDPASSYGSRHEAAVAALKAANEAAPHQTDRAIALFLLAAKRDPGFGKAVYDLGVMCERQGRWGDAVSFFAEVPLVESDPALLKLAAEALERVRLIGSLESSPEGKRRLEFDRELVKTLSRSKDPAIALDMSSNLVKRDPSRWEAPAAVGLFSAELDHWKESAAALETGTRLAPPDRKPKLSAAVQIARRQDQFQTFVNAGDQAWEDHQYEASSKAYASAWEINPAGMKIGMQAAVGYLMADQLTPAVECLARIRISATDEDARKATAMLQQLAAVSDSAKDAGSREPTGPMKDLPESSASAILKNVGNLTSPAMLMVARSTPDLMEDTTTFISIPDSDLTASDLGLLSTESVFARYEQSLPPAAPAGLQEVGAPGVPAAQQPPPNGAAKDPLVETPAKPAAPKQQQPSRPILPDLDPH